MDQKIGLQAAVAVGLDSVWKRGFVVGVTVLVKERFDHPVFERILIRLAWQPIRFWLC